MADLIAQRFHSLPQDRTESNKHAEEQNVERGELDDIRKGVSGLILRVRLKGDKAGKRCDKRTDAADVYSEEKLAVIGGKLREKYRRGHVADDLTGKSAEEERVSLKKRREEGAHSVYTSHIAREDKEEYKGQKKSVVNATQRLSVEEQKRHGYHHKSYHEGDRTEYDKYREREECKIDSNSCLRQLCRLLLYLERLGLDEYKAQNRDKRDRNDKGREHNADELGVRNRKLGVKVEILRIAEWGEHTAEVGGYVLHYVGERHILLLTGGAQHEIAERQERKKRHIVGDKHRADKGDVDEGEDTVFGILEFSDYCLCQSVEEADVTECANDRKDAE